MAKRRTWARWTQVMMVSLAVTASMGAVTLLVVASPLVLAWVAGRRGDWADLGNVGQAYGGASAILSGLALGAIAVSVFLQWRQTRIAQLYSERDHHLNLARLALDNPQALIIDGTAAVEDPRAASIVVVNLWVASWATAWQLGAMTEASLRDCGARLFETEYIRSWWRAWGGSYASSSRERRFVEVLNEECDKAEAAFPAAAPVDPARSHRAVRPRAPRADPPRSWPVAMIVVAAAIAATAAARRARRR